MKLNRNLLLSAIALAAVIGVSSVESRAGTVVQTFTIPTQSISPPFTDNFSFLGFDSSLGTLTGVTITVQATASETVRIFNIDSVSHTYSNATYSAPLNISASATGGYTQSFNNTLTTSPSTSGTSLPGLTVISFPGITVNSSTAIASGNLHFYNSNGNISFGATGGPGVSGGSTSSDDIFFGGSASVGGKVTLTYTFVTAVPEPTSSAMFGIGIVLAVGLGWGRRRRELNKLAV